METETQRPRLLLKRWLLRITVAMAAMVVLLWAMALWFEDDIKNYFLARLNKELNVRMSIGEINFSLLSNFPNASITLSDVAAEHSAPYKGAGKLLQCESLDFSFGLFDLLGGNYDVHSITMKNGSLQILRNAKGDINYKLLRDTGADTTTEKFSFRLQKVQLRNVELSVVDAPSEFRFQASLNKIAFSGDFSEQRYQMEVAGELQNRSLSTGQTEWLSNRPVELELALQIDREGKRYVLQRSALQIAELQLSLAGIYRDEAKPWFDIEAEGESLDIAAALSLLPPGYDKHTKPYRSSGEMYGRLKLKGYWTATQYPDVRVDFGFKNADIEHRESKVSLEKVNLTGTYRNAGGGSLDLRDVSLNLNGGNLSGSFRLENFNEPRFSFRTKANLNLSDVQAFLPQTMVKSMSGNARAELIMQADAGSLGRFSEGGYENIRAEGFIALNDAAFRLEDDTIQYSGFNGQFRFNNARVNVENLSGRMGKSDLLLRGSITNLFGWLFGEQEGIGITARLESKQLDLDELFSRKSKSNTSDDYRFRISPRLSLNLEVRTGQLRFRRFGASNILGRVQVANAGIRAEQLSFNTMKGKVNMQGSANSAPDGRLLITCKAKLSQVDIQRMFYEFEDFGQNVMRSDNIRGSVDATIDFEAVASETLKINPALVYSKADLSIRQGELINFQPLEALSRFISLDELKHVRFSTLTNTIEIKNRKIYIPMMDITSSAISISGSGIHDFDNQVEYHLKLLLSDLMARKAKKARKDVEEFGVVEDDGLGRTSLFISMTGPIDNPVIAYDGKGAREKIKQDMVKEKQSVKQLLREEFGLFKKDSTLNTKTDKPKTKPKVIIDFEDE